MNKPSIDSIDMYSIDNNNMKKGYIRDMNNSYSSLTIGNHRSHPVRMDSVRYIKTNRSVSPNVSLHTLYKHSFLLGAPRA